MRRVRAWPGPLVFGVAAALAAASTVPGAAGRLAAIMGCAVAVLFLARGSIRDEEGRRAAIVAVSCAGGLVLAAFAAIVIYPAKAGGPFDPAFLLENLPDAIPTIESSLSRAQKIVAVVFFAAVAAVGFRLLRNTRPPFSPRAARRLLLGLLGVCLLASVVPGIAAVARRRGPRPPVARFRSTKGLTTASREPVFILQLESVNALAETSTGAEARIFRDGVYFPFLVAGNMMTTRGQATILCGATWEFGDDVLRHPETLAEPCLPELLRRSGYRTIFFSDSPDPEFGHTREFAAGIGFEETHFGDVARSGDPKRRWGYEDSVHYRRIFDELAARNPDPRRLFVYIAVSADHFPFDEAPARASDPPELRGPSFRARYLRTLAEQDRGLEVFRRALREYTSDEAHLFVVSDHSYPIGINGSTTCARGASPDNFLTTMAYVPPASRRTEFCVGTIVNEFYGQESILPTVFEVLNGRRYPRTLGPALWRSSPPSSGIPDSPPCSSFAQPYDGRYVVSVRDGVAYRYSFRSRAVTLIDLRRDILERRPKALVSGISLDEFAARFGCDAAAQR